MDRQQEIIPKLEDQSNGRKQVENAVRRSVQNPRSTMEWKRKPMMARILVGLRCEGVLTIRCILEEPLPHRGA